MSKSHIYPHSDHDHDWRTHLEDVVKTVLVRQAPISRAVMMLMSQEVSGGLVTPGEKEAQKDLTITPNLDGLPCSAGGIVKEPPKMVSAEMRRLVAQLHELTVEGLIRRNPDNRSR